MDETQEFAVLLDVVDRSTSAQSAEDLLSRVLEQVMNLANARAAVVLAPSTEGPVIAHSAGTELPAYTVDPAALSGTTAAPEAWREAGITSVHTVALPGLSRYLVLGWADDAGEKVQDRTPASALASVLGGLRRIEAESSLADLSLRVDSAQQLAGMGDYDWHIASDTNQWSDQLYRIYGYEPQSFNASYERFLANIHPDDRERIQGIHQQAYGTGEPYHMIERIVRPDGEVRYLSSNGEVIMDANSAPVRMRGTCLDVTELILAEQERERVVERFKGLVNASPEAILVVDADGRIVQASPNAGALLGADPTGHEIGELLHRERTVGQGVPAAGVDGRDLVLDVTQVGLSETDQQARTAVFLADAAPRLEREAMAQRLGESRQRRRQAFEINDSVVQGLTAVSYALDQEDLDAARSYLGRTLSAARTMMDNLLEPSGEVLAAGDLVRAEAAGADVPGSSRSEDAVAEVTELRVVEQQELPRVLIVDDAEDLRMLLRLQLGRVGGFEIVGEAVDGLDAVEKARELQPDLVLLDMAMPRMDGLQALPLIREAVPNVRVIALSGFNRGTLEAEALAAGAHSYVTKGGGIRDLVDIVTTVLRSA